jgi:hypothetical protein
MFFHLPPLCNNGDIGDEFHYLFKCQYFGNQRKNYGFLFRLEFFFRTTGELEYFFFVAQSGNFFTRVPH